MLGRPEAVGTESEQKFHDFLVGIRTYVVVGGIDCFLCPRQECPVFVVDEESAVLDGWLFHLGSVALNIDDRHGSGFYVCPPDVG